MNKYILSIDQSTQGTKAILVSAQGIPVCKVDKPHRQIIDDNGWVEHDPEEIYANTLTVVKDVVAKAGIDRNEIVALGLCNQRETSVCWERATGKPVYNAIVWQCARGAKICEELEKQGVAPIVQKKTGIRLSPYFPAAKLAWIFQNVPDVAKRAQNGEICVGTVDSYLVFRLTHGKKHLTDYSNASRTQLFDITRFTWDEELLKLFGIAPDCMPQVMDSDGDFGETDFEGWLDAPIPIRGVLGDSHGSLFGLGCVQAGMTKASYGTGSSVMMNIGENPVFSEKGLVTSLAWKIGGKVHYVLEGNINYSAAVITWLKDDVKLISTPGETEALARMANPADTTCIVPAFSGLGAPYWDNHAKAAIIGMTRTTGKNEIVRAALDCIAFQITDIIRLMGESAGIPVAEVRVDGGATRNTYLMQFQSDMLNIPVSVSDSDVISGAGAAFAAGLAIGMYDKAIFDNPERILYKPAMPAQIREEKFSCWKDAVRRVRM